MHLPHDESGGFLVPISRKAKYSRALVLSRIYVTIILQKWVTKISKRTEALNSESCKCGYYNTILRALSRNLFFEGYTTCAEKTCVTVQESGIAINIVKVV